MSDHSPTVTNPGPESEDKRRTVTGGRYNTMPDERVDIADYLDMIRIYLLTILEICERT